MGYCVYVLDDFFFVGFLRFFDCYSLLLVFYLFVKDINFFIKFEKIFYLIIILSFLGLELDIFKFEIRFLIDKLECLKLEIKVF